MGQLLIDVVILRLFGTKPWRLVVNQALGNKLHWNFNPNTNILFKKSSKDIVCKKSSN